MTRQVVNPLKAEEVLPSGLLVGAGQLAGIAAAAWVGAGASSTSPWPRVLIAALLAGAGLGLQQRTPTTHTSVLALGQGVVWSPIAAVATACATAGLTMLLFVRPDGRMEVVAWILVALPGVVSAIAGVLRVPASVREAMSGAEVERQVLLDTSAVTLGAVLGAATIAGIAQAFGILGPINLLAVLAVGGIAWALAGATIRRRRF